MASASRQPVLRSAHMRRVNELIYASVRRRAQTEPIGYFCECASARCFETVLLTGAEYDARRAQRGGALLADGH